MDEDVAELTKLLLHSVVLFLNLSQVLFAELDESFSQHEEHNVCKLPLLYLVVFDWERSRQLMQLACVFKIRVAMLVFNQLVDQHFQHVAACAEFILDFEAGK